MDLNKQEIELLIPFVEEQIENWERWGNFANNMRSVIVNKDGSYHKQDSHLVAEYEQQQKDSIVQLAILRPLMEKLQNQ